MRAPDAHVLDASVDPSTTPTATVSVVVPAHDEARTLGGTLAALTASAGARRMSASR
jgi:hypothetical protein